MINMKPITDDEKYEIVNSIKNGASPVYDDAQRQSLPIPIDCICYKTKESHLEDEWIAYNNPCEHEELTYALIYVERLPYRLLCNTLNRKCFSSSMLNMIRRNELTPFLLFVNGLFIPWQDIEILRDGNDNYLKLNGKDYLYEYIKTIKLYQIPYNVIYQGIESDGVFHYNYEAFVDYLDSNAIIKDNQLYITLPDIDTTYKYKNKIYDVGYWMYTQIKEYRLGKLPNDRYDKLRQIVILKEVLNYKNELIKDYSNSVNVFDKDSYDNVIMDTLVNEYNNCVVLLNFDTDGKYIDPVRKPTNANTIYIKNSSYSDDEQEIMFKHMTQNSYTKLIGYHNMLGNLYRANFLVFKNGILAPDYTLTSYGPIAEIDARKTKDYDKYGNPITQPEYGELEIVMFYDKRYYADDNGISELRVISHYSNLLEEYRNNIFKKAMIAIESGTSAEVYDYMQWFDPLYCKFENNVVLEDNVNTALSRIIEYDNRMLNSVCKRNVYCKCFTGKEVNEKIYANSAAMHMGFDIPRMKYEDFEVYPLIFLNGLLYEQYCNITVHTTHLFIPSPSRFADTDCIEVMYFLYVNNNELSTEYRPNYALYKNVIPEEDIKVFSGDVRHILHYKELKYDPNVIAFRIEDRDEDNKLSVDSSMVGRDITVVSSRKFVYERLYIDRKTYKIRIGAKFRYCDNMKQYSLFINGKKVPQEFYLITIPKTTRPFDYMYIYTAKFVIPSDRIELFYLPIELNFGLDMKLSEDGIIESKDQSQLYAPLDKECYVFFVNGRKIPKDYIVNIDSNRLGVMKSVPDKYSYELQNITVLESYPVIETYVPEVRSYISNKHKSLIDTINYTTISHYGLSEMLDNYNIHDKLADVDAEPTADVARIAILNEVVRDFWVTSGYDYNKEPFLYDYETDEYMVKDRNGNYTLPALDALPKINIDKEDLHTLYFKYTDYMPEYFEKGRTISNIIVQWDFNDNYQTQEIEHQWFCGNEIDTSIRAMRVTRTISSNDTIWLEASNGFSICRSEINFNFCDAIYYGCVPEDRLDGRASDDLSNSANMNSLLKFLIKSIQPTRQLKLDNFYIDNSKYFVVVLPDSYIDSRLAFFMPDPRSDYVLNNIDDKTLPVFTNGKYEKEDSETGYHGNLVELDKFEMQVLYKRSYTNAYGYTTSYTVYKANGYFTRLFENVPFTISIK